MTTSVTNNLPGRHRRSLNDTIGHLDQMIDGLSEAIPGTIRDTLQETVGAAISEGVRAALLEIVNSPEVLALLRSPLPPVATPMVSDGPNLVLVRKLCSKIGSAAVTAVQWCKSKVAATSMAVTASGRKVVNRLAELGRRLRSLRQARRPILVALAVGGLAAVVTLFAPGWVAATLSGVGGAGATLAVQAGLWLRQRLGTVLLTSD
jgi:hypothetical protein